MTHDRIAVALGCVLLCGGAAQADPSDPNSYATQVVSYTAGTGIGGDWITGKPFNDPNSALGRPTVDTTGDAWYIPLEMPTPVVHVYPSFRYYELVTIGNGGELVVRFNRPIENDPRNPYGVDFVVFGNAFQIIDGVNGWTNGDPNSVTCGYGLFKEPGIVSVAQDPNGPWYTFTDGPWADDFGPTLGRVPVDDPNDADPNLGTWNAYWGGPTDPTRPINPNDPSVSESGFIGKTVRQMCDAYNGSAGGTGFDIGVFGLDWIQYVRVQDRPGSSATTEIDAFSDVAPGVVLDLTKVNETYGEVTLSPDPVADPPTTYLLNEVVTLTATPIEGKAFNRWVIYDPNFPGDANHAAEDTNTVTTIVMMCDRQVEAAFKCGSALEMVLPLPLPAALAVFLRGRRRRAQ
ncbi:MAG: hypothetical protein JXQ73_22495 [Phycisphaerae bacterium]|nr:hypothetical protein [Phycisphaerae bacterium]